MRASLARRCAAATGSLALALALGAAPALGAERLADPLSAGPLDPIPGAQLDATPIRGDRASAPPAVAAGGTKAYEDPDGHRVRVRVSDAYSNQDVAAQALVDFLGSLIHGDEIDELYAQIATPSEIRRACGAGALACYYPDRELMVVSGEAATDPGEPPREFVVAHEYGHHVAHNRDNAPWSALGRGTKRWSSYENICKRIATDRINPRRYWQAPGEAFAEAYAFYRFPSVIDWQWRIGRPDGGAFDAIFADVTEPWAGPTESEWSGALGAGDRNDVRRLATPLDGRLKLILDGPPRADFDLRVRARRGGRVLARATTRNARERLRYTVCGRRSVKVVVKRKAGGGEFELRALNP